MIHEVKLSDRVIPYDLERKKVKNINLRIKPNGNIYVSANNAVSISAVNDFILSKEKFVLSALKKCEDAKRYAPKPKEYVDGETFIIFGHDIRLKVFEDKRNYVKSDEAYIYLYVKNKNDLDLKRKTMDKWLMQKCKETILMICESVYPKFQKYGIDFPQIKFRNMTSRWGSCQPKKNVLTFNYKLISAPIASIESVVVHEFVHFLVPNHSRKFYETLSVFLPDWEKRKKILDKEIVYGI